MNRRDSSTRDYYPNPRPARTERLRRRRRKQVTILLILAIIAILLIVSGFFVLKDVITSDTSDGDETVHSSSVGDASQNVLEGEGDISNSPETGAPNPPTTNDPDSTTTAPTTNSGGSSDTPAVGTITPSNIGKGPLVLVNDNYAYTFPDGEENISNLYNENEKVTLSDGSKISLYQLSGSNILFDSTALYYFKNMCRDLVKATGYNVYSDAAYRSYATQEELYNKFPSSASMPGKSDHNTGYGINLAVYKDSRVYSLGYNDKTCTAILAWINANAHKYGFVRRFDPQKSAITGMKKGQDDWHYRYVGEAHAYYMAINNLCLEEYLALIEKNYVYGKNSLKFTTDSGNKYEIFFMSKDNVSAINIPQGKTVEVSGNNYNGFIVAIKG
jgi:D-alanyl-D-alanine carboxypeptidase